MTVFSIVYVFLYIFYAYSVKFLWSWESENDFVIFCRSVVGAAQDVNEFFYARAKLIFIKNDKYNVKIPKL